MAWDHVPQETFEAIIKYLDLHNIKNLRLVSKSFSTRCLGPHFLSFFHNATTDLTQSSLQEFSARTSHPGFKSALSNLTILATAYDPSRAEDILATRQRLHREVDGLHFSVTFKNCTREDLSAAQSDLTWLKGQQNALDALSDEFIISHLTASLRCLGKISTIRLHATVIDAPQGTRPTTLGNWHYVWHRASRVHYLAILAIFKSRISVDSLDIFGQTPRCSVPSADITAHIAKLNQNDLKTTGTMIKKIALSVSTKVDFAKLEAPTRYGRLIGGYLDAADPNTLSEDNFPGITQLLKATPNLNTLYLHLYRTVTGDIKAFDQLFTSLAQNVCLPKLEVCSLSGLFVKEDAMLQFLEKQPRLRHVEFEELVLTSGSWEPVFRLLGKMAGLSYLRLSSLFGEDEKIVNLQPVWDTQSPTHGILPALGALLVYQREFHAEDIKMGLEFWPSPYGYILGSARANSWREMRCANYGLL